jgi:hypothetical protein
MANNQQPGGNSIAALLGNMRGQPGQQQPQAAYGGGLQAPTQPGASPYTGMTREQLMASMPAQGNAIGYQSPAQQQWNTALGGAQQAGGVPTPKYDPRAGGAQRPGGFQPMPSTGAPGGGAAGKAPGVKNTIAQLPGGPPMGGGMGRPRPRPPGMQPGGLNPALMRQVR